MPRDGKVACYPIAALTVMQSVAGVTDGRAHIRLHHRGRRLGGVGGGHAAGPRFRLFGADHRARAAPYQPGHGHAGGLHGSISPRTPSSRCTGPCRSRSWAAARRSFRSPKALGGGSAVNAMVYMRGQKEDYDGWATGLGGNAGEWSYDDLLPHFKGLESNRRFNNQYHGIGGNLRVSDPGHISDSTEDFLLAAQGLGHALEPRFQRRAAERGGHHAAHLRAVGPAQAALGRQARLPRSAAAQPQADHRHRGAGRPHPDRERQGGRRRLFARRRSARGARGEARCWSQPAPTTRPS